MEAVNSKVSVIFECTYKKNMSKDVIVVFASDVEALTSCGAMYQTISHVIRVKLCRSSIDPTSVT